MSFLGHSSRVTLSPSQVCSQDLHTVLSDSRAREETTNQWKWSPNTLPAHFLCDLLKLCFWCGRSPCCSANVHSPVPAPPWAWTHRLFWFMGGEQAAYASANLIWYLMALLSPCDLVFHHEKNTSRGPLVQKEKAPGAQWKPTLTGATCSQALRTLASPRFLKQETVFAAGSR